MKQGGRSKKKTIEIRPSAYYITLIALAISNLSVFMLGVVFSNMLGASLGNIAEQGYRAQAAKAALYYQDDGSGDSYARGGGGGGNVKLQPTLLVTIAQDPKSDLVLRGANLPVARFDVQAKYDAVTIDGFSFTDVAPSAGIIGDKDLIADLTLYEQTSTGPVLVASGGFPSTSHYVTLVPGTPLTIQQNQQVTYTLHAHFANHEPGSRWYQESGAGVAMQLYAVQANPVKNKNKGVSVVGTGIPSSSYWSFNAVPTVTMLQSQLTKTAATSTTETLAKFKVTSGNGPVGVTEMSFRFSNPTMLYPSGSWGSNLYLYESDSEFALGTLVSQYRNFERNGATARARFDVNNDNWASFGQGITESLIINAGSTKFFTLRALTSSTTGTMITTLMSDTQPAGTWPMNVLEIEQYGPSSNFIWSDLNFDLYSSSTATSTRGWFNGFKVPGL